MCCTNGKTAWDSWQMGGLQRSSEVLKFKQERCSTPCPANSTKSWLTCWPMVSTCLGHVIWREAFSSQVAHSTRRLLTHAHLSWEYIHWVNARLLTPQSPKVSKQNVAPEKRWICTMIMWNIFLGFYQTMLVRYWGTNQILYFKKNGPNFDLLH